MKKIILILLTVFMTVFTGNAQLNVVNSGSNSKEAYLAKDMYSNIKSDNCGYTLNVKDCQSNQYIMVMLGTNTNDCKSSIEFILNWVKTSPKKAYIEIQTDNGNVTFYKYTQNQLAISYGDAEYIKKKINALILNATVGSPSGRKHDDPLMGYVQVKQLEKALQNM